MHLGDFVNKAKLFDSGLKKTGPIFGAKVISISVDYSAKMERILDEMRTLIIGLEPKATLQPMPLEEVPNLFIIKEIILLFECGWL